MQEAAESQNESHMDLDVSSIEADDLQVFLQIKKECRPGSSDLIMESLVELPERRDSSIAADLTSDIPSVKRNDQPEISDSAKLNMLSLVESFQRGENSAISFTASDFVGTSNEEETERESEKEDLAESSRVVSGGVSLDFSGSSAPEECLENRRALRRNKTQILSYKEPSLIKKMRQPGPETTNRSMKVCAKRKLKKTKRRIPLGNLENA
eukprot:m.134522 g.134522  ORF g.134522 m.134522 type:complete len:211 (+) comp38142_c0_seq5:554-1186(+)